MELGLDLDQLIGHMDSDFDQLSVHMDLDFGPQLVVVAVIVGRLVLRLDGMEGKRLWLMMLWWCYHPLHY